MSKKLMPKAKQPFSLLMCRPTYYTVAYEINPWMHLTRKPNQQRALKQWNALYLTLTHILKVKVHLLPPHREVPDLVFTANAGLVSGKQLLLSNFRHPERQCEVPYVEQYFTRLGFKITELPLEHNFEGEGDALWMNQTLVMGFRFRSDAHAHERLSEYLKARVLPVELVDQRFYHLDTCFAPLDKDHALWYPKAFDRYGQRVIESLVPSPIAVTKEDARRFVCNAIVVGRSIVMQEGASSRLKKRLESLGYSLYPVNLSEFLKAGGSAKCLVLRLTA